MCDEVFSDCQSLIAREPQCHGWIKIKKRLHEFGESIGLTINKLDSVAKKITNALKWDRKYLILCNDTIFIFNNDTAKAAEKILRIADYSSAIETTVENKEIPWPIKMKKRNSDNYLFFAPISQNERKKWISCLNVQLAKFEPEHDPHTINDRPLPNTPASKKISKGFAMPSVNEDDDDKDDYSDLYEFPDTPHGGGDNSDYLKDVSCKLKNEVKKNDSVRGDIAVPRLIESMNKELDMRNTSRKPLDVGSRDTLPIGHSLIPRKPLPAISPKPELNNLHTFPKKVEQHERQVIPIKPMFRKNEDIDDGVYDIQYKVESLSEKNGFWSGTVEGAKNILDKCINHNGTFLVRNAKEHNGFTLSVIESGSIRKFSITTEGNLFKLNTENFNTLNDLITHYTKNNLPQKNFKLVKSYYAFR